MRRRWKRRLLWAAVLLGLVVLAIPAWVSQAAVRLGRGKRSPYGVELAG